MVPTKPRVLLKQLTQQVIGSVARKSQAEEFDPRIVACARDGRMLEFRPGPDVDQGRRPSEAETFMQLRRCNHARLEVPSSLFRKGSYEGAIALAGRKAFLLPLVQSAVDDRYVAIAQALQYGRGPIRERALPTTLVTQYDGNRSPRDDPADA